jgi:hypothetical protein
LPLICLIITFAVDASDVRVGAVLFQEVSDVDRPISFFPKKLDQD